MTQNRSSAVMQQRKEPHDSLDDFPTPPWATRALCEVIAKGPGPWSRGPDDPTLKSTEINVETFKGEVQLSGFVESQANIDRAASLARGIKGATSVKNNMHVKGQ